jgi:hypothetical protein
MRTEFGTEAKRFIYNLIDLKDNPFIQQWLQETYPVFCVIKYNEENTYPVCFALLHKMDFDPLNIFDKPVLLDYIYTMPKCRRNMHAYKLLIRIIKKNKVIGFCCNDESEKLFIKCGFSYHPNNQFMVRFPPLISSSKNGKDTLCEELLHEANNNIDDLGKNMVANLLLNEYNKLIHNNFTA